MEPLENKKVEISMNAPLATVSGGEIVELDCERPGSSADAASRRKRKQELLSV